MFEWSVQDYRHRLSLFPHLLPQDLRSCVPENFGSTPLTYFSEGEVNNRFRSVESKFLTPLTEIENERQQRCSVASPVFMTLLVSSHLSQ